MDQPDLPGRDLAEAQANLERRFEKFGPERRPRISENRGMNYLRGFQRVSAVFTAAWIATGFFRVFEGQWQPHLALIPEDSAVWRIVTAA